MLMPPNQPPTPDPYGFILNPEKPKRGLLFGGGIKFKLILTGIVAFIVITGGVILGNSLDGPRDAQKDRLIEIAQTQTEIVRLSTIAENKAGAPSTKSLAITTKLSTESSLNQTKEALAKYGVKSDVKLLNQGKNQKSDTLLDEATNNNRFDETYKKLMSEQLANYQKLLKSAFESGSKSEKVVLNSAGVSNTLVLQMIKPAN